MKRLALILAATLVTAAAAVAQPAPPAPQAIRGTVVRADAASVVIRPRSGPPLTIALTPDWTVQVTRPIDVSEIREGSFIGTAEIPQADGSGRSLEVHVFPPGVKVGEGHYAWNLRKGSMMTNGTVGKVTVGGRGRELLVSYPTGERRIVVPPRAPVVQITNGTRAMVKPGAPVFLMAFPKPGGGLITGAIAVGDKGAPPPM